MSMLAHTLAVLHVESIVPVNSGSIAQNPILLLSLVGILHSCTRSVDLNHTFDHCPVCYVVPSAIAILFTSIGSSIHECLLSKQSSHLMPGL